MRNRMMAVLPLALAMATTACSHEGKDGQDGGKRTADAGPATTQSYDLKGFTGVKVAGPDDVTIRRGEAFAITAKGPKAIVDDARNVTIPVHMLLQWDDEGNDRQASLDLFDALGSPEKTLCANLGGHAGVPAFAGDEAARFFARHLR